MTEMVRWDLALCPLNRQNQDEGTTLYKNRVLSRFPHLLGESILQQPLKKPNLKETVR